MAAISKQLVWLITGASSGLGRELAISVLNRGDKVIATARARSIAQLDGLKAKGAETLELDITAPLQTLHATAVKAIALYGRVDVVVNNAGYMLVGPIEEMTPEETYDQFNTNVFGALNVTRAFLPYMRERGTGTIMFIGSVAGEVAWPAVGIYASSKWAIRGISHTLHEEIAPFGLRSVCVEPGHFRTALLGSSYAYVSRIEAYKPLSENVSTELQELDGKQPGDPVKGCAIIVDLVKGEGSAKGKAFPKVLLLGGIASDLAEGEVNKALKSLEEWREVSTATDF